MNYKHFSTYERGCIEAFTKAGYSARKIAEELKRHHSSISRELKRNSTNEYIAKNANQSYQKKREKSKPLGKYEKKFADMIEKRLCETWSPEQIANTDMLGKISFKTIYNWIYNGKLSNINLTNLRQKGKRHKLKQTRGKFNVGESIHNRPKEVKDRLDFGHWELDTVVSSRGESKGCLATFLERKSRLYTAIKMKDRSALSMEKAICQLYYSLPEKSLKTATSDRGKEFACYKNIKKQFDLTIYFADPYSSWQRGSNENSNGLLREFYPKKTDLSSIHQSELTKNLFLINSRPRKCLGWKSPIQVFLHEVSHLT